MPTDLSVVLDDSPGELAKLGEAIGLGGVNIEGMAAFTGRHRRRAGLAGWAGAEPR